MTDRKVGNLRNISPAREVTSRPITQPEQKKTFWLKRRPGFAKTKNFFYHPGLDRHGAVDVSGDLDVPRAHGGRRNPGVEFDSALRRLVLHEPSVGDPQIRSSASGFGLPGLFLQAHPLGTLAVQQLAVSAPFTVLHRSDLPDQRPKTKKLLPALTPVSYSFAPLNSVKQKVVECVAQSSEAQLQLILRTLQDLTAQGLQDKMCANIVISLGTIHVPTEPSNYMQFISSIKSVQDILTKECMN
ncbi:hypothetical protein GEV33_004954 [Tenebrio molitor]|uniref:Uncharacterized protein n=1 Tax=Tenebrio molitor TaxID=7067 RepID=A0A8J6LF91_TENMO|nr:hypothetical protein GEV33_004954 [Tenebrio molitor]